MPIRRNYIDIKGDGKYRLENNTPITNFSNTGTANGLLDVVARETETIYDEVEYLHNIMDPTKAFGTELDKLGFIFGTSRSSAVTASDLTSTNFYFYLDPRLGISIGSLINKLYPTTTHYNVRKRMEDQGFIDSANAPTELIIPVGTVISNSDASTTYTTLQVATITNNNSEAYVPVIASIEGGGSNIEANVLIKHTLNEYDVLRSMSKYIMCSNRYPISTGLGAVPDSEYRYNLSLSRTNYGVNEVAARQAAFSIPGVRNVF